MHAVAKQRSELGRDVWWTTAAVLTGILTMAFGMFAVVVAIPKVMTAFGADVNGIQWVMTGYLIARAVPTPAIGWLVGCLGKRQLFLIGVIGMTTCSSLCGFAWDLESLIFFRILQGALGAPVMAVGMVILYESFPPHRQGLAMGLIILVASLGPTIGQLCGGYLVEMISWRAIFFLALPSGVTSLVLTLLVIPNDVPTAGKTIDIPGLTSMTVFLVALLLALTQGQHQGWDSNYILSLWAIAVAFFAIFVATQLVVPNPVVHLRLYRHFSFTMASIVVFLYNAGFMGANFLVALMLQAVFNFTPIQAGYILAPGAIVMGFSGFLSGKFSDRLDPRWLMLGGLLCFVVNLICFASLTLMAGVGLVTLLVIFQRGGFGMIHSSVNTAVMRTLPAADRSMGSGLHNLHRGIGMSFGVALCSMLLEKRLAVHQVLMGQQHDRFAVSVEQTLSGFRYWLNEAGVATQAIQNQAFSALHGLMIDHVRMAAYTDVFAILAILFLGALVPAWFVRAQVLSPSAAKPQPETHTPVSKQDEVDALAKSR